MPKAIQYKANSVIYFSGDLDDRVMILNKGHVALTFADVETGSQVTEYIKTGEFFGVKSALGNFPREENAITLVDSIVYAFGSQEFEAFAQTNIRIVMKMLKVFSRQLRSVHRQLESLLDSQEETNNEEGLYTVARAFHASEHYLAASQVAQRYRELYPDGKHRHDIASMLESADGTVGRGFEEAGAQGSDAGFEVPSAFAESAVDSEVGDLRAAELLEQQGKWGEAYEHYRLGCASNGGVGAEAAYLGAGRCLFEQREFVRSIQTFTECITRNPKSTRLAEVLMYLGQCYQGMGRPDKAISFYDKALSTAPESLVPRIKELQRSCEEASHG
ncbi:cyclic nucleotide-binding protein [Treponema pallidum subsp. pallidum]|nr:cyclic nucleotide-binding protein [Treponema pallidum subsp. pallidum]